MQPPDVSTHSPPSRTAEPLGVDVDDVSVIGLANVVLMNRRLVAASGMLIAVITIMVVALAPRSYKSTTSFMPQVRKASSNVSGVAAQFGLTLPGNDGSESPDFYVDLLKSRPILDSVAAARYSFVSDTGSVSTTILNLYTSHGNPQVRHEETLRRLRGQIDASASQRTNVVTVTVVASAAALAQQIAQHLVDQVNIFNRRTRRSQASAEREFAGRELADAATVLRNAEDRYEVFLQENRQVGAPRLRLDEERLTREISMRQQVYTMLAQQYEQAKLDEVRDTPAITTIESANLPASPVSRGLLFKTLFGLVVGLALGVLLAFIRVYVAGRRLHPTPESVEFTALSKNALQDLKHPLRVFHR